MRTQSARDDSVDLLRGLVMVVMGIDHVRDFFGSGLPRPTDLAVTTPALFFTRWITHYCAPAFVLLAGVGTALSLGAGRSRASMSRFLLSRGLWLILLEVTVIRFAWSFDLSYGGATLQVIWALGVSMLVLAGLIHLPVSVTAAFGLLLIVGHNALDTIQSDELLWTLLHHRGRIPLGQGFRLFVMYPIVPWVGVMACGYALGTRLAVGARGWLVPVGAVLCGLFVLLRWSGVYGDPAPFVAQDSLPRTIMAFLNCEKYPPSLDYLLMTLGPLVLALGILQGRAPFWASPIVTFGRVPLFYYVAHLYLAHGLARVLFAATGWSTLTLGGVWLVSAAVVAALYPACEWYAGVKQRRRDLVWLSYL